MSLSKSKSTSASGSGSTSTAERLKTEQEYNSQVQKLYEQTTKKILTLQKTQVAAQKAAVVDMTGAFQSLVTQTTEMVGLMIGQLLVGGQVAGKNFFASFLDMVSQFSVLLGSMAIAASKMLEMLFTGNPAGLFVAGLALVLVGGVIKAFANSLRAQGSSGSGVLASSGGNSTSSSGASGSSASASYSVTEAKGGNESKSETTIIYSFQGGVYDERGLARIALGAINKHAGKSAPLLSRRALETT